MGFENFESLSKYTRTLPQNTLEFRVGTLSQTSCLSTSVGSHKHNNPKYIILSSNKNTLVVSK